MVRGDGAQNESVNYLKVGHVFAPEEQDAVCLCIRFQAETILVPLCAVRGVQLEWNLCRLGTQGLKCALSLSLVQKESSESTD